MGMGCETKLNCVDVEAISRMVTGMKMKPEQKVNLFCSCAMKVLCLINFWIYWVLCDNFPPKVALILVGVCIVVYVLIICWEVSDFNELSTHLIFSKVDSILSFGFFLALGAFILYQIYKNKNLTATLFFGIIVFLESTIWLLIWFLLDKKAKAIFKKKKRKTK